MNQKHDYYNAVDHSIKRTWFKMTVPSTHVSRSTVNRCTGLVGSSWVRLLVSTRISCRWQTPRDAQQPDERIINLRPS